jgi:hypothetical protein
MEESASRPDLCFKNRYRGHGLTGGQRSRRVHAQRRTDLHGGRGCTGRPRPSWPPFRAPIEGPPHLALGSRAPATNRLNYAATPQFLLQFKSQMIDWFAAPAERPSSRASSLFTYPRACECSATSIETAARPAGFSDCGSNEAGRNALSRHAKKQTDRSNENADDRARLDNADTTYDANLRNGANGSATGRKSSRPGRGP